MRMPNPYVLTPPEQYDDHVWLDINGEEWAIERIERFGPAHFRMALWRVADEGVEYQWVDFRHVDWSPYVEAASAVLAAQAAQSFH